MSSTNVQAESPPGGLAFLQTDKNIVFTILKFLLLFLFDALAVIIMIALLYTPSVDTTALAVILGLITIFGNAVLFVPRLYPLKWMAPGLMLVTLLVIFPIIFTVATAFTNYGDGHLYVKERAIDLIANRGYVPETARTYQWTAFRAGDDEYALWLVASDGDIFFARPGEELEEVSLSAFGVTLNEDGPPSLEGFEVVEEPEALADVEVIDAGQPVDEIRIGSLDLETRYFYNIEQNLVFDQERGNIYNATVFANEAGEIALWLTETADTVNEAYYAFPDSDLVEVDPSNTRERLRLRDRGIDLPTGAVIPNAMGDFNRVSDPFDYEEALRNLNMEGVDDGLRGATVNLDSRFVFDPAQGVTLDMEEGDRYETTVYRNDSGEYAFYLDAGRTGNFLVLPDETVFVDNVPTTYAGYNLVLGGVERNQALSFLQDLERGYFGGEGQSLGLINTRAAGQPYLLRYVYNLPEDAFIDLSSINTENVDLNANDLRTADLFSIQGLADVTLYDADDELGQFVGRRLRLVKNEVENAYVDLFSANIGNPAAVSGEGIATTPVLPSISINGARFYVDYPEQEVFAPQNYLYNANANAFIDPRSTDADESTLTSASLDELAEIEGIRVYVLNEDSGLFAPPTYVYNDSVKSFIDLSATELDEEVDLATENLLGTELVNELTLIPPSTVSGDLLNYEALAFADSDPGKTFVLAPDTRAEPLRPGYRVGVGFDNFVQLWDDRSLLEPLVRVFVWTVAFAFFSVLTTFALGLFMAIILNDARMPAKKLIRSMLIVPYAIPGVIAIVVWRGMLNENLGIITQTFAETFGVHIPWFSDATWAKIAILIVNLWLGYPYMMLICSGALQAIPSEVYEAAAVDGAKPMQRFWNITLPLLLITVGPLLIASFVFNFNNYLIIEALTNGNPPIPGTSTPAGETDILITYTYNLAFGGRGADYGYASAITIVIFIVVALITLFQFRFTRRWEEAGENV